MNGKIKQFFVAVLLVATLSVSCTHTKWTTMNLNKTEMESLMSRHFPELYERYQKGEIVVDKLKSQPQDDGTTKYQITYAEVNNDDDDELLLWLTIYAPMLLQ